ncbi:MAG: recombinase family protein [Gammaproteobacteria bacterium]|nr:recombinase family protein [Gammaproteobacteria bacterium]
MSEANGRRVAIYARYSSDLQSDSSVEDQVRLCSELAKSKAWEVFDHYADAGLSGASLMRPGIQALITDALDGKFDIVLAEALDRISRDQEDIAGVYKRMEFAGVEIVTLSEGPISSLHIGLKGTMNALFLKDLADKTRRGLRGRVERGKSGGGIAYGYDVVKRFDVEGNPLRGDRSINEDQAAVVRRIFKDYARNQSPRAIASQLNAESIPSPSGKTWSQSAINGNRRRGTGILNNELYIGRLVWNRQRFIKDPDTGKRVTRLNDESEWITQEVPELRIVPQELWDKAKARQKSLDERKPGLWRRNRPRYLLSGLIECGECGGGYSKINTTHYGCSATRDKGESVCTNRKTIAKDALEGAVLTALQTHLMREDLVETFCQEYAQHLNELRAAQHRAQRAKKAELRRLKKRQEQVIQSIYNGVDARMIKDESKYIADRLEELEAEESQQQEQPPLKPLVHPAMANRYRQEVENLKEALNRKNARAEASEHLRALIGKIVLTPESGRDELRIDLHGDLAGILQIASQKQARPGNKNVSGPNKIALVAGAGFEPATFGL